MADLEDVLEAMAANAPSQDHPFWWTDEEARGKADHPDVQAILNLENEGTPEEAAENCKHRANQHYQKALDADKALKAMGNKGITFGDIKDAQPGEDIDQRAKLKTKRMQHFEAALNEYTAALAYQSKDTRARSIYYANRAAVHLSLGNYGKVVEDCKNSLELDNTNIKAYYRLVKALNSLEKFEEAIKWADQGLKVDPDNQPLKTEKKQAQKQIQLLKQKEEAKYSAHNQEMKQKIEKLKILKPEFEKRGIALGRPLFDTQGQYTDEVYLGEDGALHWPVLFLYPQFNQSDYIRDFNENDNFKAHLEYMFSTPPEWDTEGHYTLPHLEIYTEVGVIPPLDPDSPKHGVKKRWIKVKQTTTLGTVLSHKDYVVPQFPVFYIISNAATQFKEDFLKRFVNED